jgi:hypothetical protein
MSMLVPVDVKNKVCNFLLLPPERSNNSYAHLRPVLAAQKATQRTRTGPTRVTRPHQPSSIRLGREVLGTPHEKVCQWVLISEFG